MQRAPGEADAGASESASHGRLMALLSVTSHWVGRAFVEGEIPFSGRGSNGGFWSGEVENALSFN
jgi:hypothetical protein